ncbi:hypothetical protein L1887_00917 [Cichorium endivia]|nr:hypothetical protein L1887_00917 [Cichorium endivia]
MESKQITLISDLHVLKDDFTIKVSVIRMWNQMLFENPNEKYSIEMVLIDEQGNKIQACVPRRCIPKFEKILQENVAFLHGQAVPRRKHQLDDKQFLIAMDVVSYTGDNTTPMSEVQKNSARDICEENHLKCNLSSAFDVDDNSSMSSTKVRAIGMEDGTGKGIPKLLIPKLEK